MGIDERVDNYNGRMQDIWQRMGNRQIPDDFLMSIFIGGLYPMELRTYVKEGVTSTYAQAYTREKIWEECRLENELVICTDNTYSNNPIPSHSGTFPIIENNHYYVNDAPYVRNPNAPLYTQLAINTSPPHDPTSDKYIMLYGIWNMSKQLSKLSF